MKPSQISSNVLDKFIEAQWGFETPAYQVILKERLSDLCRRDVNEGEAIHYLKSAGWSIDFAVIYSNFLKYVKDNTKVEETEDMKDKNVDAIPVTQVQQLLRELVIQLASAASFRPIEESEDIKEYRKAFMEYLAQYNSGLDATAKEQTNIILQELKDNLKRSDELARTLSVFFK
jgi:hypothetical protein